MTTSSWVADALRHNKTAVGCAGGLDKVYLASAPDPSMIEIFAVFGENGEGATRSSNVDGVHQAIRRGATIHWWAGGKDADLVQRVT